MRSSILRSKGSSGQVSDQGPSKETLEPEVQYKILPVRRVFRISDLLLVRQGTDTDLFTLEFSLERERIRNSGKNQESSTQILLLRLKAVGKELALLSNLLDRDIEIEEERTTDTSKIEDLQSELQRLRESYKDLEFQHESLKNYLMESQRPRKVS